MPSISKEEREAILSKIKGRKSVNPRDSNDDDWRTSLGVMAEIDEDEAGLTDLEAWDIARVIVNIPGSLARNIGLIGDMAVNALNPDMDENTIAQVGKLGLSGLHAGARAVLGDGVGSEEDTRVFWQFADEMKKRYGTELRKSLVEDPIGMVADIGGIFTGGGTAMARAGGTLGKFGNMTRNVGKQMMRGAPGAALEYGARKTGQAANAIAGGLLPELGALSTGMPATTLKEAFGGAARPETLGGMTGRQAVLSGLRGGEEGLKGLYHKIGDTRRKLVEDRGTKFRKDMDAARNDPIDARAVKADVEAMLKDEWNITPRRNNDGTFVRATSSTGQGGDFPQGIIQFEDIHKTSSLDQRNRIVIGKNFTKLIDFLEDEGGVWPKGSIQAKNALKAGIPEIQNARAWMRTHRGAAKSYLQAQTAVDEMRRITGNEIKNSSRKAWDAIKQYEKDSIFLEDLEMVFKEGSLKEMRTTIGKVLQAFRENPSADITRGFLEDLELKASQFFKPTAAGAAMSQWMPTGIHARAIMLGAVGSTAFFVSPVAALALPFVTSPRLVGELLAVMGAGSAAGKKFASWLDNLHDLRRKNLPGLPEGVAIGTAVQRLLEQGVDVPPIPEEVKPFKMPAAPKGSKRSPSQILGGGFAG